MRHFVIVCANGRDREEVHRLGLRFPGYDRVHLLVLGTIEHSLRGLRVDGWAITEYAEQRLGEDPRLPPVRYLIEGRSVRAGQ